MVLLAALTACSSGRAPEHGADPEVRSEVETVPDAPRHETVVLVHGLARSSGNTFLLMRPRLEAAGYRVALFDYASLRDDVASCGARLREALEQIADEEEVRAVHLLTHSMGALVARAALGERAPAKVGRLVMMAPPNQGSGVARALEGTLGRWIPAIGELSSRADSTAQRLPVPAGIEIGVIAASWDHMVSQASTHLRGQSDHISVRGMHSSIPYQEETSKQVLHFLQHGRFQHELGGDELPEGPSGPGDRAGG